MTDKMTREQAAVMLEVEIHALRKSTNRSFRDTINQMQEYLKVLTTPPDVEGLRKEVYRIVIDNKIPLLIKVAELRELFEKSLKVRITNAKSNNSSRGKDKK